MSGIQSLQEKRCKRINVVSFPVKYKVGRASAVFPYTLNPVSITDNNLLVHSQLYVLAGSLNPSNPELLGQEGGKKAGSYLCRFLSLQGEVDFPRCWCPCWKGRRAMLLNDLSSGGSSSLSWGIRCPKAMFSCHRCAAINDVQRARLLAHASWRWGAAGSFTPREDTPLRATLFTWLERLRFSCAGCEKTCNCFMVYRGVWGPAGVLDKIPGKVKLFHWLCASQVISTMFVTIIYINIFYQRLHCPH